MPKQNINSSLKQDVMIANRIIITIYVSLIYLHYCLLSVTYRKLTKLQNVAIIACVKKGASSKSKLNLAFCQCV